MYLKKLSLQGFKSFADRTVLEFEPGITGVVGPNGSGKSNIADAIRWILGEQRIKNLRGSKLEDVVFAGSEGSKPVGMAEVSIVLDNADNRLGLDYSEVAVSRRVFRSGESEFLINGSPVRLRDIQELFMDTGVGRDAYCVLSQSDTDVILSPNSEDRKRFFEEAAGVVKFRVRKQEAQRRLAETESNLTRLDDILHEIKSQLGPLARQAKKAERYREYQDKLRVAETVLLADKFSRLELKVGEFQAEVDELRALNAGRSGRLSAVEANLEQKRLLLTAVEKQLEQLRLQDLEVTRELEQCNAEIRLAEEKARRWEEELARNQQELQSLTELTGQGESEVIRREEIVAQAASDLDESRAALREAKTAIDQSRAQFIQIEQIAAQKEQLVSAVADRINQIQVELGSARTRGDQARQDAQRVVEEIAELNLEIAVGEENSQAKAAEIATLQARAEQLLARREKLLTCKGQADKAVENALRSLEETKELVGRARSELSALRDLEERGEDLYSGVRQVLKAADARNLHGIVGVVADLVEVPQGFEIAMETALGSNIQCIAAADDRSAEEAINWLKAHKAGRATFLPLNIIKGRAISSGELHKISGLKGYLGLASDLVGCRSGLDNLREYLLGRTLVAEDLSTAKDIARETGYRFQVVTRDGEIIRPGGSMTGGSQRHNSGGLLARKGRIKELETKVASLEKQQAQTQSEVACSREDQELCSKDLIQTDQDNQELRVQLVALEREKAGLDRTHLSLLQRRDGLDQRLQSLDPAKAAQTVQELEDRLRASTEEKTGLEKELALAKNEVRSHQSQFDQLRALTAQAETEEAIRKERYDRFQAELKQTQEQLASLAARKEQCRLGLTRAREGKVEAEQVGETAAVVGKELSAQKEQVGQDYAVKREERESLQSQLAENENELKVVRREVAELTGKLHEFELELTRVHSERTALLERAQENYDLDEVGLAQVDLEDVDLEQAQSDTAEMQSKLKMLGPINPEAESEYQQARERFDFLSDQYTDLVKAKEDLYNVIADIEASTEEQFLAAFEDIQREFGLLFQRLFGGGNAYLTLTDPEDISSTGVEIMAQPPGKNLQNLALLSSGERSLTAIALLMATLRVNPAPFTVLDEVDAALDDANLERFGDLLNEFSRQTQFIIITHRRRTMEVAGVLYGVTMQKGKGYSEVVSVKLSDVD